MLRIAALLAVLGATLVAGPAHAQSSAYGEPPPLPPADVPNGALPQQPPPTQFRGQSTLTPPGPAPSGIQGQPLPPPPGGTLAPPAAGQRARNGLSGAAPLPPPANPPPPQPADTAPQPDDTVVMETPSPRSTLEGVTIVVHPVEARRRASKPKATPRRVWPIAVTCRQRACSRRRVRSAGTADSRDRARACGAAG